MQAWLIGLIIVAAFGVFVLISKLSERHQSSVSSPYFRRNTIIVDWDYGLVGAEQLSRTSEGYVYVLSAENEGKVEKVYGDNDLVPLNPHLNVVGYQTYIDAKVIAHLSDKVDINALSRSFESDRAKIASLQGELADWRANFDAKVEQYINNQERLGRANRTMKKGGA